jgi:protein-S-isoprenylcysteine O-methyltransferase Ste14
MSFGIYLIGYIIFCVGLLLGMSFLHVPPRWIGVAALVLLGLGIATGVTKTRTKDS